MGETVTIASDQPFALALARGLLGRFGQRDLARVRLLLPSRRAALVMQEAFLAATGGAPLLLPRMAPVGDVTGAAGRLDGAAELGVPPAMSALRRRFILFRLVRRVDDGMPHEQAFRLADALAALLDELADEAVPLEALLAIEVADAARHWDEIARFLSHVAAHWPAIAAEAGALGRSEQRHALLRTVAARWREQPPGPVVLAGVTGSVPAVAELMAAVAAAPEGLVVLPGLDRRAAAGIGPTHPQWGFARLLERLGLELARVDVWPEPAPAAPRAELLRAMSAPADAPSPPLDLDAALAGVALAEAPDVATEALAVALELRALLESEDTALVVAPDRQLARRIGAELARYGLAIEDSGGQPLDQTAPGNLALLVVHACLDAEPVVPALAMLKHPLARAGADLATCRRRARRLELHLRDGVEAPPGWAALAAAATADDDLAPWFAALAAATAALRARRGQTVPVVDLVAALRTALDAVAADNEGATTEFWAGPAGAALAGFLDTFEAAAGDTEPVAAEAFAPMLASAMAVEPVRRIQAGHPQIEILGRFEARLASADLVVLTGLNEGTWPPTPDPGPWLGRRQRESVGLPPPEQHVGFAAHDFVQLAASADRLLLTRSRRDAGGAPTQRSRFLDQLQRAVARRAPGRRLPRARALDWALAFDRSTTPPAPRGRPRPAPPPTLRPQRLSVSDVERLIHNPYSVYAERVLRLRPLDPPTRAVDARERGTLVHRVLEAFAARFPAQLPADVAATLMSEARAVFDRERLGEAVVALWLPRFRRVAEWFAAGEPERRRGVRLSRTEQPVTGLIQVPGATIELRGRIDRLDVRHDGRAVIYDYKTGTAPAPKEVRQGQRPQLPLLGLLLAGAEFDGVAPVVDELVYLELKGGEPAGRVQALDVPALELVALAEAGVTRLLAAYARGEVPYLPVPRPPASAFPDPFAPLSRDQEWLDAEARS